MILRAACRFSMFALAAWAASGHAETTVSAPTDDGTPAVFADFASPAGEAAIREVRLEVDGRDVTAQAEVGAFRVAYVPEAPLAPGAHAVRVTVVDAMGRTFEKSWTFQAAAAGAGVRQPVVAFFADDLRVELDPLPARTRLDRVRVAGVSQPDVEIEIRVDDTLVQRTMASHAGRFGADVALPPGQSAIAVTAVRPLSGDAGPEVVHRVQRVVPDSETEPPPEDDEPPPEDDEPPPEDDEPPPEDDEPPPEDNEPPPEDNEPPPEDNEPPPEDNEPPSRPWPGVESPPVSRDVRDAVPSRGGDVKAPPDPPLPAEVVITRPDDGDTLTARHVTVLGKAPAGWRVTVLVGGRASGDDLANPAGRFTVPNVRLEEGANVLVAEAEAPDGPDIVRSTEVHVTAGEAHGIASAAVRVTSPTQRAATSRTDSFRLEGFAWPGAIIEVDANGRLATTSVVGAGGRFVVDVPLEPGLNHVIAEAFDPDSGRTANSGTLVITRSASAARRLERPPVIEPAPVRGGLRERVRAAPVPMRP